MPEALTLAPIHILNWWQWWDARKFHIVPAFRGFNISGLNLVETGHSMSKVKGKMWLSVATWRDICFHIVQANKYTAFIENTGKGPTLLQGRKKEKRIKRDFISSCNEKLADDFGLECELEYDSHKMISLCQTGRQSTRGLKRSVIQIPSRNKLTRTKEKREKWKQKLTWA